MNFWWITSGGIGLTAAGIHLIAGHFDPIKPLTQSDLAPVPRATLHACWHRVTVILFFSAGALVYLGMVPEKNGENLTPFFIGGQFIAYAIVFFILQPCRRLEEQVVKPPAMDASLTDWHLCNDWRPQDIAIGFSPRNMRQPISQYTTQVLWRRRRRCGPSILTFFSG